MAQSGPGVSAAVPAAPARVQDTAVLLSAHAQLQEGDAPTGRAAQGTVRDSGTVTWGEGRERSGDAGRQWPYGAKGKMVEDPMAFIQYIYVASFELPRLVRPECLGFWMVYQSGRLCVC